MDNRQCKGDAEKNEKRKALETDVAKVAQLSNFFIKISSRFESV